MKTWKDHYNDFAQKEREYIRQMPIENILADVKNKRYGQYYTVWEIIAQKSTLEEAGMILIEVLEQDIDYLIRMNCASYALLKLMPDCPFSAADLGGDHDEVKSNVAKLKAILQSRFNSDN